MTGPDRPPSSTSTDLRDLERPAAEAVPETWDEARDPAFFRLAARVFDPTTTLAMTVLLASYDPEPANSTGD